MSEVRKWEELNIDSLENILSKVGMESLVLDVPFVCKSWHKASNYPSCWQHIDVPPEFFFQEDSCTPFLRRFIRKYDIMNFSVGRFISLVLPRGIGNSTSRALTLQCGYEDLEYVAEKCPELKSIALNSIVLENYHFVVTDVIGKLKQLEEMALYVGFKVEFVEIVALIGQNCDNFNSLIVDSYYFTKDDALAIANHIPKIKKLSFKHCCLKPEDLEIIQCSCRDLEVLDVSNSYVGGDVSELASNVKALDRDACGRPSVV